MADARQLKLVVRQREIAIVQLFVHSAESAAEEEHLLSAAVQDESDAPQRVLSHEVRDIGFSPRICSR
jgi:hypothetical protein